MSADDGERDAERRCARAAGGTPLAEAVGATTDATADDAMLTFFGRDGNDDVDVGSIGEGMVGVPPADIDVGVNRLVSPSAVGDSDGALPPPAPFAAPFAPVPVPFAPREASPPPFTPVWNGPIPL